MNIAVVNYAFAPDVDDPEALLDRYTTLTGWGEALLTAGADRVRVAQRFHRDARLSRAGVEYVFVSDGGAGRPQPLTWPRALHRAVAVWRPDIAHVNGLDAPVQTWLLRRMLPLASALVVQDHGSRPVVRREPYALGLRRALRRAAIGAADAVCFTAAEQGEAWRAAGLLPRAQRVVELLEASTRLRPTPREAARRALAIDGNPSVLWVGRLNANKDPLTILEGFASAAAVLPDARLTMVYGEAELLPQVEERMKRLPGLSERVQLVGPVNHAVMADVYSAADIFVSGSHHEAAGYALIEACACGAVPVVTNIPAFRAITGNGALGALWNPAQPSSLARALVETAQRDLGALRARLLDDFARRLSWPAVGRQALDAYADIIVRRRAAYGAPRVLH
jgi:glycosyltransferase involved in cell wall biosynthesis